MTDFGRVNAGDSEFKSPALSASWLNAASAAAEDFQRRENGEAGDAGRALKSSSGLVSVKNVTGSDLVRGHYVQLGDYLLTTVNHRRPMFNGDLYDPEENGRIAIITKAVKQNAFEDARTIGQCTALINITDITHRYARPEDGLTVLQSATSGPVEILSVNKISGTSEQELTVLLGSGGSSAKVAAAIWIVTTQIDPATGTLPNITPGTGFAVQGEVDPDTGDLSPMDMTPVAMLNYDPGETYLVDTGIYVADVSGTDLTMVLSGHCIAYNAAPEDP